jgi:circadian clock protein KaiB
VADLRDRLPGLRCEVEVVDLLEHPDRAGAERIMATPTLIRLEPGPTRRIVGDLRDADSLMVVLELDLLLRERAAGGGAVA